MLSPLEKRVRTVKALPLRKGTMLLLVNMI